MAVWPNGSRTPPKFSSLWKEYSGKPNSKHWGLDSYGYTYNCAIAAGVVTKIGYNTFGGGGHEVYYKLDASGDVIVTYHNRAGLLVEVGDRLDPATRLGVQSDSGKADGIHNHTEVWIDGYRARRVDPLGYIAALVGTSPAGGGGTIIDEEDEEEMTNVYGVRTNDGSQFIFGDLHWTDYGDGNRAEITARHLCPNQVVGGVAVPKPMSAHEVQINFESQQGRVAKFKAAMAFTTPNIDVEALAEKIAPLLSATGAPSAEQIAQSVLSELKSAL